MFRFHKDYTSVSSEICAVSASLKLIEQHDDDHPSIIWTNMGTYGTYVHEE